jgi:exoribonuclease R
MEYKISEEEIRGREDLRDTIVFTCDPKTARDLDDALSIKYVGDSVYEVNFFNPIIPRSVCI